VGEVCEEKLGYVKEIQHAKYVDLFRYPWMI
jgi:hypothetical protein